MSCDGSEGFDKQRIGVREFDAMVGDAEFFTLFSRAQYRDRREFRDGRSEIGSAR